MNTRGEALSVLAQTGDRIHDGVCWHEITGEGKHPKLGSYWRVRIIDGHQMGATSIVFKDSVKRLVGMRGNA